VSNHIISHTKTRIGEGGLEPCKQLFKDVVKFVDANHPRVVGYSTYINEDGTEARAIQVHPDSESFELHLRLFGVMHGLGLFGGCAGRMRRAGCVVGSG
jgi:hypothetical protein